MLQNVDSEIVLNINCKNDFNWKNKMEIVSQVLHVLHELIESRQAKWNETVNFLKIKLHQVKYNAPKLPKHVNISWHNNEAYIQIVVKQFNKLSENWIIQSLQQSKVFANKWNCSRNKLSMLKH